MRINVKETDHQLNKNDGAHVHDAVEGDVKGDVNITIRIQG